MKWISRERVKVDRVALPVADEIVNDAPHASCQEAVMQGKFDGMFVT